MIIKQRYAFGIMNLEWTFNHQSFKYFENRFRVTLCRKIEKYDELS